MKIEENERLAALLTARVMGTVPIAHDPKIDARQWRDTYRLLLREFMELEKAQFEAQK